MTQHWLKGLTALPFLLTLGAVAPGCASDAEDCETTRTCTPPQGGAGGEVAGQGGAGQGGAGQGGAGQGGSGGEAPMASCLPWENAAGVGVPAACGVFVAASAAEGGDGSRSAPYASLTDALGAAQPGAQIYLCKETFEENVTVPDGVSLFGGLDCSAGWTYDEGDQSVVTGEPDAPTVRFLAGALGTSVYDVGIVAPDAVTPSASSVAALVEGGNVALVRVHALAGNGAAGTPGTQPTVNIGPTNPNDSSIRGNAPRGISPVACNGNNPSGALEKSNPFCSESVGGRGGAGESPTLAVPQFGGEGLVNGGDGGAPSGPLPSFCGDAGCCASNGAGEDGGDGLPGLHGVGASGFGALSADDLFTGTAGSAATRGYAGAGGGGGAGAFKKAGLEFHCGGGGNGGGAGGCGGHGGSAGQPGGGSFALIVLGGTVTVTASSFTAGDGGDGGDGGLGQPGAVGGNPGAGGVCSGGKGGNGGNGGVGGGGAGGHSAAIVHGPQATLTVSDDSQLEHGTAGQGGVGGDAGGMGVSGLAGTTQTLAVK